MLIISFNIDNYAHNVGWNIYIYILQCLAFQIGSSNNCVIK